ncbi:MAG: N-acetyltransferase family protein [Oligoflexales bacterium]
MLQLTSARDIEANSLMAMMAEIYRAAPFFCQSLEERYPTLEALRDSVHHITNRPGGRFDVGVLDQRLVGFVQVEPVAPSRLAHTAWVTFGVLPSVQGKGIARAMYREVEKLVASHGIIEILYLMTRADNSKALLFNQNIGFEQVALLERDTKINDTYYDGVMMRKFLRH